MTKSQNNKSLEVDKFKKRKKLEKIKAGRVFFIQYISPKNDGVRKLNFIGRCIKTSNKTGRVTLKNNIKKTKVLFSMLKMSPALLKVKTRKRFSRKCKKNRF